MKKMKRPTAERRLVSIPAELNAEMKKHEDVNWSDVARIAFENKLAELDPVKQLKEAEAAVKRLREQVAKKSTKKGRS